jgi:hypothetical protein
MAHPVESGSFGFFWPSYEIGEGAVTLARKPLLAPMSLLVPAGVYSIVYAFTGVAAYDRQGGKLAIVFGFLLIVLGVRGFLASPLWPPGSVKVTSSGVKWGGLHIPAAEITGISVRSEARRNRNGMSYVFKLVLEKGDGPARTFPLAISGSGMVPPQIEDVLSAIHATLGIRAA